jgi:hypothetical protein
MRARYFWGHEARRRCSCTCPDVDRGFCVSFEHPQTCSHPLDALWQCGDTRNNGRAKLFKAIRSTRHAGLARSLLRTSRHRTQATDGYLATHPGEAHLSDQRARSLRGTSHRSPWPWLARLVLQRVRQRHRGVHSHTLEPSSDWALRCASVAPMSPDACASRLLEG